MSLLSNLALSIKDSVHFNYFIISAILCITLTKRECGQLVYSVSHRCIGSTSHFRCYPFLVLGIKIQKPRKFFPMDRVKKPVFHNKSKSIIFSTLTFAILLLPGMLLLFVIDDKTMIANAQFATKGWQSIGGILIYSIIQTGLSEELLFRGFFLKIFSNLWGLGIGSFVQALLFGLLHGVILFASLNFFLVITIIVFSTLAGWLMSYVNNTLGNGSILPSWFIHSSMNIISSLLLAFNFL